MGHVIDRKQQTARGESQEGDRPYQQGADNSELTERLQLVNNHNEELQELLNKTSADTAVIEAAISSALESLDSLDLDDLGDFGTLDSGELAEAENFTLDGTGEDLDTFEDKDF